MIKDKKKSRKTIFWAVKDSELRLLYKLCTKVTSVFATNILPSVLWEIYSNWRRLSKGKKQWIIFIKGKFIFIISIEIPQSFHQQIIKYKSKIILLMYRYTLSASTKKKIYYLKDNKIFQTIYAMLHKGWDL